MANIPIWPGSSSFSASKTPFGFYDVDASFITDADKVAKWCARRLGYPITNIELQDLNFYAAFEEAITEYGNQVNTHTARDVILGLLGSNTGSQNLTQEYVPSNLAGVFQLAEEYGTEAGSGGNQTYYTASIAVKKSQQMYDLTNASSITFESGSPANDQFTVRRIFHDATPALVRYFDPFIGTGLGTQNLLEQFGFGNYSPGVSFLLMPMHFDVLRLQAIEFNDKIRKSGYSFQLINNRLRIFPVPTTDYTVYFEYTLDQSVEDLMNSPHAGSGKVSDYSNIPYNNMIYAQINDIGKQWIRKYALALSKEILGYVRSKYSEIPIPGSEVTLNGEALLTAAASEKDALIEELRDTLDQFSRQALLERKQAEAEALENQLSKIPLKIYLK